MTISWELRKIVSARSTVTAVSPGAGTPSGTVTFTVNGNPLGSAPLSAGVATFNKKVPTAKIAHVAASYGGDSDFTLATGGSSLTLQKITPTFARLSRKVVATDTLAELEKSTHPWIREYFLGPRGRAAARGAS